MHLFAYIILIIIGLVVGFITTKGVKSQWIRLIDIFVYGPFLIFLGTKIKLVWVKVILILMGATTISYNLRNYIESL